MAKFYGKIGFIIQQEIPADSGIWKEAIVEKVYCGDLLSNRKYYDENNKINDDIELSMKVSIIADGFIQENIGRMKYVTWNSTCWKVKSVSAEYPRLILEIGGIYVGQTN